MRLKDEAGRPHEALSYPPSPAVIGDFGAVLVGCPQRLFCERGRGGDAPTRWSSGKRIDRHTPPAGSGEGGSGKRNRHERHRAEPLSVEPEKREPRHAPGRRRDGVTG